jgi:hypothetical protein
MRQGASSTRSLTRAGPESDAELQKCQRLPLPLFVYFIVP